MKKIKVTKEVKEFEGDIENKVVTPFGNSGHINIGKGHIGKILSVIFPARAKYVWLLSNSEKSKFLNACNYLVKMENGRLEKLRLGLVEEIEDGEFYLGSLIKLIKLAEKHKKETALIKKIRETYDL